MKQLVKKILPTPVLNQARKLKDNIDLTIISSKDFTTDNLRTIEDLPLDEMYANQDIKALWDIDKKAIQDVYGGDDNFGGVNPGDRRALYYLVMALKPKNTLEVGTHIGASTLHIARALKQLNQSGHVTTVDIIDVNDSETGSWKGLNLAKSPQGFAEELECDNHITFHCGPCLDLMNKTNEKFDFIFLDGDHTAAAVYKEVSTALGILNEKGVILLHDYYPNGEALFPDNNIINGPYNALERITRENPAIKAHSLGTLPWPTKQGTSLTSLALVIKA